MAILGPNAKFNSLHTVENKCDPFDLKDLDRDKDLKPARTA